MALDQVKDEEPTLGKLVTDASRDISTLVSKEIQLAKTELKVSVKAGGIGSVLFVLAGFLAFMALILGSIAVAYFIHEYLDLGLHWAYSMVVGAYLLLAALLVFVGIRKVKQVRAPERAIAQAQETKEVLSNRS
jgi:hypothetical protein